MKGTVPKVGDRVLVEAAYNANMPFKWNATRIQVLPNQVGSHIDALYHPLHFRTIWHVKIDLVFTVFDRASQTNPNWTLSYDIGKICTNSCGLKLIMFPSPLGQGGHLDLLCFPITQMCVDACLHPFVPDLFF